MVGLTCGFLCLLLRDQRTSHHRELLSTRISLSGDEMFVCVFLSRMVLGWQHLKAGSRSFVILATLINESQFIYF